MDEISDILTDIKELLAENNQKMDEIITRLDSMQGNGYDNSIADICYKLTDVGEKIDEAKNMMP